MTGRSQNTSSQLGEMILAKVRQIWRAFATWSLKIKALQPTEEARRRPLVKDIGKDFLLLSN